MNHHLMDSRYYIIYNLKMYTALPSDQLVSSRSSPKTSLNSKNRDSQIQERYSSQEKNPKLSQQMMRMSVESDDDEEEKAAKNEAQIKQQ